MALEFKQTLIHHNRNLNNSRNFYHKNFCIIILSFKQYQFYKF